MTRADLADRYKVAGFALVVSAGVHAAVLLGIPPRIEAFEQHPGAIYSASLDPEALTAEAAPAPAPRRAGKPRPRPAPPPPEELLPALGPEPELPALAAESKPPAPKPEVVAMAKPPAPPPPPEPKFPVEGFPANVTISYSLSSAFADGRAEYRWSREGDQYRITGEAEAVGFFTLFLEGRILQESRGIVTDDGLRPERFVERKPNHPEEGLEFDWPAAKVTFDARGERKTAELKEKTVDWLSMIFHLAHVPPAGENYELRVYTQRKMYTYKLNVLGIEELETPMGKLKGLHLRHVDPKDNEVVDVWLGVDHHYLPIKLRFPVARNRLVVEQTATAITSR